MLIELFNSHGLTVQFHVKNAELFVDDVAFFTDLYHSTNYFVFDEKRVEAEVAKHVREIMVWDFDLTEVGHLLWRCWLRQK